MPNIGGVFQEEIVRLAKKVVRQETAQLKTQVQKLRAEAKVSKLALIHLKRELDRTQRALRAVRPVTAAAASEQPKQQRKSLQQKYRPEMLVAFAEMHQLCGMDIARLLGSTPGSAYNWLEGGIPRRKFIDAFFEIHKLSKRAIAARLKEIKTAG